MASGGDARLKSLVERIERLRHEKKELASDERDIFAEAKSGGYDGKALREVLRRRSMDDTATWDALVETYEAALGVRGEAARIVQGGGSYDEAASKTGLSRATVARAVASRKNLKNETRTNEIQTEGADSKAVDAGRLSKPSGPAEQSVNPDLPSERVSLHHRNGQGAQSGTNSTAAPEALPQPPSTPHLSEPHAGEGPDSNTDDLTIPQFLRREAA